MNVNSLGLRGFLAPTKTMLSQWFRPAEEGSSLHKPNKYPKQREGELSWVERIEPNPRRYIVQMSQIIRHNPVASLKTKTGGSNLPWKIVYSSRIRARKPGDETGSHVPYHSRSVPVRPRSLKKKSSQPHLEGWQFFSHVLCIGSSWPSKQNHLCLCFYIYIRIYIYC